MSPTNHLILAIGAVTVIYGSVDLAARYYSNTRPAIERFACRFMICADDVLVASTYRSLFSGEDPVDTVTAFRDALSRDAVSAYRWADLGEALLSAGKTSEARRALLRALELAPYSTTILLRAATFFLRIGENNEALPHTSRILSLTEAHDPIVFSYYSRLGISTADILNSGLSDSKRAVREYFRFCLRRGMAADAEQIWHHMLARRITDNVTADEYANALLSRQQFSRARQAWIEHHSSEKTDAGASGMVFNAGFEQEPVKNVFDWHIEAVDSVHVRRDSQVRHSGEWSLHVGFGGTANVHLRNVMQVLPLDPGVYRVSAYVRTRGITTDKGVGLRVVQHSSADTVCARTPAVTGTSDWAEVTTTFPVSRGQGLLRLEVSREPSLRIDNRIKGDAWIDSVHLERVR